MARCRQAGMDACLGKPVSNEKLAAALARPHLDAKGLYLAFALIATSCCADAVVIRDDVKDSRYRVPASSLPALADSPCEGHGLLIAPQWVLTVAHVASPNAVQEITIDGLRRKVKNTIVHPGYRALPGALAKEALASGDSSKAMAFLAASDDIALSNWRNRLRA